jgi:hypothetical protein
MEVEREHSRSPPLAVLSHTLHAHIEQCMKTEDVARQMMKNDLDRTMKDWRCTSKEELTNEAEARSWDETIDNVWLRMVMCDHLLEFKTWRQDDPKPLRGIYLQRSQGTYAYSGKTWKSSWENQHRMKTLLGQIYRNNNGNYYGKVKQCGRNMQHTYGTQDTRR